MFISNKIDIHDLPKNLSVIRTFSEQFMADTQSLILNNIHKKKILL